MDINIGKKENKKKKMKTKTKLKGGKKKMFGKKKKDKPIEPPPVEDAILPEDSEEVVNLKKQIAELENKTEEIKEKKSTPAEQSPEQPDEELTEDKVKAILINFEQRLQRIEYNLRLIP